MQQFDLRGSRQCSFQNCVSYSRSASDGLGGGGGVVPGAAQLEVLLGPGHVRSHGLVSGRRVVNLCRYQLCCFHTIGNTEGTEKGG